MKRCKYCSVLLPENDKEEKDITTKGVDFYLDKKLKLDYCGYCREENEIVFATRDMAIDADDLFLEGMLWKH